MAKTKKTNKTSKLQQAANIGYELENVMYDSILAKVPNKQELLDAAFITAFKALSYDMAHVWKKDFLLGLLGEVCDEVSREHPEENDEPHVCKDCQEKVENGELPALASKEVRNKMH